jgi:hypothetical protein
VSLLQKGQSHREEAKPTKSFEKREENPRDFFAQTFQIFKHFFAFFAIFAVKKVFAVESSVVD